MTGNPGTPNPRKGHKIGIGLGGARPPNDPLDQERQTMYRRVPVASYSPAKLRALFRDAALHRDIKYNYLQGREIGLNTRDRRRVYLKRVR